MSNYRQPLRNFGHLLMNYGHPAALLDQYGKLLRIWLISTAVKPLLIHSPPLLGDPAYSDVQLPCLGLWVGGKPCS